MLRAAGPILATLLALSATMARADSPAPLPPGIVAVHLLPGWTREDGTRIAAFQILLEPGWKTYWRNPGDAGVPPVFDWSASANVAGVTPLWPRPDVFESAGMRTLGFHDKLLLPLEVRPVDPAAPVTLNASIEMGVCRDICVPVNLTVTEDPAGADATPDIREALARQPTPAATAAECTQQPIADGTRVTASLRAGDDSPEAAMEIEDPGIWVSQPDISAVDGKVQIAADFVGSSGKPFDVDLKKVRVTLLAADKATEYLCAPAGG
ncbi:protein-disulfide reductase DsbD domain-containing protein [Paracoccus pacificus]|uniref:Protein-disulfide reductase DsbD domain-containing protein n=1 Tax=Paracoccus pacificus TaxID=1463598 RepID=A0ABW4RAI5_9RHOB